MERTVTLEAPGCLTAGVVMHEFLHTLGMESRLFSILRAPLEQKICIAQYRSDTMFIEKAVSVIVFRRY